MNTHAISYARAGGVVAVVAIAIAALSAPFFASAHSYYHHRPMPQIEAWANGGGVTFEGFHVHASNHLWTQTWVRETSHVSKHGQSYERAAHAEAAQTTHISGKNVRAHFGGISVGAYLY